jgi:hypothetical protein
MEGEQFAVLLPGLSLAAPSAAARRLARPPPRRARWPAWTSRSR